MAELPNRYYRKKRLSRGNWPQLQLGSKAHSCLLLLRRPRCRLVATANPALKEKNYEVHEIDSDDDEPKIEVASITTAPVIVTSPSTTIKIEKEEPCQKSSYPNSFAIRRISAAFALIGRPFLTTQVPFSPCNKLHQ